MGVDVCAFRYERVNIHVRIRYDRVPIITVLAVLKYLQTATGQPFDLHVYFTGIFKVVRVYIAVSVFAKNICRKYFSGCTDQYM